MQIAYQAQGTKGKYRDYQWNELTLEQHYRAIRDGAYAEAVALRALCTGDASPDEVSAAKDELPFVSYSAEFPKGKGAKADIERFGRYLLLDFDEKGGVPSKEAAAGFPGAKLVYSSSRGTGLHLVVELALEPRTAKAREGAWDLLNARAEELLGCRSDDMIRQAASVGFVSVDPDAVWLPAAKPYFWLPDELSEVGKAAQYLAEQDTAGEWECDNETMLKFMTAWWNLAKERGKDRCLAMLRCFAGYDELTEKRWDKGGFNAADLTMAVITQEAIKVGYKAGLGVKTRMQTAVADPEAKVLGPTVPLNTNTDYQSYPLRLNVRSNQVEVYHTAEYWLKAKKPSRHLWGWGAWDEHEMRKDWFEDGRWGVGAKGNIIELAPKRFSDALLAQGSTNPIDPVQSYLDEIEASEPGPNPLIERVFIENNGAEDSEYIRAVTRCLMIGAVQRIYDPGSTMAYFPVLHGEQGSNKDTVIRAMVPGEARRFWVKDDVMMKDDTKKQMEQIGQAWWVSFPEGGSITRADMNAVKAFITRVDEVSRMAYDRTVTERDRRWVGVISLNNPDLPNDSQMRRFPPIKCQYIKDEEEVYSWFDTPEPGDDLPRRERIYAQAKWLFEHGETSRIPRKFWAEVDARAKDLAFTSNFMDLKAAELTLQFAGDAVPHTMPELMTAAGLDPADSKLESQLRALLRAKGWKDERKKVKGVRTTWWTAPPLDDLGLDDEAMAKRDELRKRSVSTRNIDALLQG